MSPVMADPFELRLFFSNRLRALNPCEDTTDEVVAFALKHRDLDEDLWNCVLEQLENVSSKSPIASTGLIRFHRKRITSMFEQTLFISWRTWLNSPGVTTTLHTSVWSSEILQRSSIPLFLWTVWVS